MKPIGSRRPLTLALAGVRRDVTGAFQQGIREMSSALIQNADGNGTIPAVRQVAVRAQIKQITSNLFTGPGDQPFAPDGVTALAPYPRLLNKWLAWSVYQAVQQHEKWMRRHVPQDVLHRLQMGRRRIVSEQNTSLFQPNPLARIDPSRRWVPPHQWTDDRGYRLSDRIWRSDLVTRQKIDELLAKGLQDGQSALNLSKALEAYLLPGREGIRTLRPYGSRFGGGGASADAMRLARTEIARAFNSATQIAALMNPYVDAIDVARSPNGDPSCPICPEHATIDIDGSRIADPYPVDEADVGPFHPHCVTGDTLIQSPGAIVAAVQSFYNGRMIEVFTAGGQRITCTPNHSILSDSGWIEAQFLNKGQNIVVASRRERETLGVQPDDNDMPMSMEEIFNTLLKSSGVTSRHVPCAAEDFHSDGRFMNGDVHIVNVNRFLLRDSQPGLNEPLGEERFCESGLRPSLFLANGDVNLVLKGFLAASNGGMEIGDNRLLEFGRLPVHPRVLSFRSGTHDNPIRSEFTINDLTRDPRAGGETFDRFASVVALDEITDIREVDFSGHVYDLQIEPQHWYIANDIITHNCMCNAQSVVGESPQSVTDDLRQMLQDSGGDLDVNPSNAWNFTQMLLGAILMQVLVQVGLHPAQGVF